MSVVRVKNGMSSPLAAQCGGNFFQRFAARFEPEQVAANRANQQYRTHHHKESITGYAGSAQRAQGSVANRVGESVRVVGAERTDAPR